MTEAQAPDEPQEWCVHWCMVISATDPVAAAQQALTIHRDNTSIATVFEVYHHDREHSRAEGDAAEVRVATVDLGDGTEAPDVEYD